MGALKCSFSTGYQKGDSAGNAIPECTYPGMNCYLCASQDEGLRITHSVHRMEGIWPNSQSSRELGIHVLRSIRWD